MITSKYQRNPRSCKETLEQTSKENGLKQSGRGSWGRRLLKAVLKMQGLYLEQGKEDRGRKGTSGRQKGVKRGRQVCTPQGSGLPGKPSRACVFRGVTEAWSGMAGTSQRRQCWEETLTVEAE